ncbi:MAG TPA: ABC transporter permease, partial [Ktedonobacterales bacterium]
MSTTAKPPTVSAPAPRTAAPRQIGRVAASRRALARRAMRRGTLRANVSSALEALWANRLRSLLTALGVIVGVAAVIGAVTITQGTGAIINSRVAGLGTNTLTISPGASNTGGVRAAAGSRQTLTQADA